MAFEVKGKIKVLFDQQDFPSGFYKRDFVVTTNEQYPQDIKFGALKERTEQLRGLQEGDEVLVKFDIRGREYNGNYYVDLNAWRIERGAAVSPDAAQTSENTSGSMEEPVNNSVSAAPLPSVEPLDVGTPSDDDLPF